MKAPVLDAYETAYTYRVWCSFCRYWHSHSKEDGHRVAHCHTVLSPYYDSGYFIKRVGTWQERPRRGK